MEPVLLSILSSRGFETSKPFFSSLTPVDLHRVNLSEPAFRWSADRQLLAAVGNGDADVIIIPVTTINEGNPKPIQIISEKSVSSICFSQKSSWICTWRKPISESDLNMAVWSVETGVCIVRSRRTRLNSAFGDPVQWSNDEKTVWIQSGGELLGYEIVPDSTFDPCQHPFKYRLHVPNMVRFWLSPLIEPCYRVLVLVAEKKGEPAKCTIYNSTALDTPVCSKSFYQSDDVEAMWSPAGHAVLVKASATHDASGKSYYGSASLYLLLADGYNQPMTIVAAGSDGTCADAQWNPIRSKREFGVICGRHAWICNSANGKNVIDFGMNAWNTFRYSPSGRYIVLGGFGNLPGKLWFFDRTEKQFLGTGVDHVGFTPVGFLLINQAQSSKFIGWSPDSQYVTTARLFPARRVDNGFMIFTYAGNVVAKYDFDKLLDAQILALKPLSEYPNIPTSAEVLAQSRPIESAASTVPGGATAGSYVPPSARAAAAASGSGPAVSSNVSAMLHKLRNSNEAGVRIAAPVQKTKKDDPNRAAKMQAKKERRSKAMAMKDEENTSASNANRYTDVGPVDTAKALKTLKKKLRQIQHLKTQLGQDKDLILNSEQLEKISREEEIIEQINSLTVHG